MAWVRKYSVPNVVGARKLKALIFYTIDPLLYDKRSLCVFEPLFGVNGGLTGNIHQGAKVPRSESSREQIGQGPIGTFAPGSELAQERKSSVPMEHFCNH